MKQIAAIQLTDLLTGQKPPCISLYQPTHRNHPENQQDPIRYRNLVAEMEASLRRKYPASEVRVLLEKFQALARDDRFWNHRTDGLAILASAEMFQIFELQHRVRELIVVADSYHLKPLLRAFQTPERFQVLALSRSEAKLYEGDRNTLDPVELTNVPSTITEALGAELTEQHLTVASYGAGPARAAGSGAPPSVHGHGDKKGEVDVDRDRFFRVVDRGILEHHSRPSGLPLMLAALTEHHQPFRAISHNPFLMADGITTSSDSLSLKRLHAEAWRVIEPTYSRRLTELADNYRVARSRQLGSDDVAQVAEAATAGRVGTLLIEADRQIPGKIDPETGRVTTNELADPEIDDMLDDLGELVLKMKGEVLVLPADRMPTGTGVAATYRF